LLMFTSDYRADTSWFGGRVRPVGSPRGEGPVERLWELGVGMSIFVTSLLSA
jgi:hypothetical protein